MEKINNTNPTAEFTHLSERQVRELETALPYIDESLDRVLGKKYEQKYLTDGFLLRALFGEDKLLVRSSNVTVGEELKRSYSISDSIRRSRGGILGEGSDIRNIRLRLSSGGQYLGEGTHTEAYTLRIDNVEPVYYLFQKSKYTPGPREELLPLDTEQFLEVFEHCMEVMTHNE